MSWQLAARSSQGETVNDFCELRAASRELNS